MIQSSITINTSGLKKKHTIKTCTTPTQQMKQASAISTILRTYVVQNENMNSVGVAPADFVIQPDISKFGITELARADEMAEIGKAKTRELISKLRELLCVIDPLSLSELSRNHQ